MRLGLGIGIDRRQRPAMLPAGASFNIDFRRTESLSFSSGLIISGVTDLSGNGRNAAQATVERQPLLVADGINGRAAAYFAADGLIVSHNAVFQSRQLMVFMVVKTSEAATNTYFCGKPTAGWRFRLRTGGGNTDVQIRNGANDAWITMVTPADPFTDGNPHVIGLSINDPDGKASIWRDGVVSADLDIGAVNLETNPMYIGSTNGTYADTGFTGYIGQMVVYPYDASKIAGINSALASSWGITL